VWRFIGPGEVVELGFAAAVVALGGERRASRKEAMGGWAGAMNLTRWGEGGECRGLRWGEERVLDCV
jgi:hypothetical protein